MDDYKDDLGLVDEPRLQAYRFRRAIYVIVTVVLGLVAGLNSVEIGILTEVFKRLQ